MKRIHLVNPSCVSLSDVKTCFMQSYAINRKMVYNEIIIKAANIQVMYNWMSEPVTHTCTCSIHCIFRREENKTSIAGKEIKESHLPFVVGLHSHITGQCELCRSE